MVRWSGQSAARRLAAAALAGWSATVTLSAAPVLIPTVVQLQVGGEETMVTEQYQVDFAGGELEITWPNIPAEADLSTLVVRSRYVTVEISSWLRMPLAVSGGAALALPSVTPDPLARQLAQAGRRAAFLPAGAVVSRFRRPWVAGRNTLTVSYRLPGLAWSAQYQLAARGEQKGEIEPLSVDLLGWINLANPTARGFSNAQVRLIGANRPPVASVKEPGFVDLENTPLATHLAGEETRAPHLYRYDLPGKVTLPPLAQLRVPLVDVMRKPAERLYVLKAEDFPLDSHWRGLPLRKYIVVKNDAARGLGFPMPPGPMEVFLGGMRTLLLQDAWLPHTPPGGEIRMDLGTVGDVRGARRRLDSRTRADGYLEADYAIQVENQRAVGVRVEVDEKPSVALEWSVLRANRLFDMRNQRMRFTLDLAPGETAVITYQLRIRKPLY